MGIIREAVRAWLQGNSEAHLNPMTQPVVGWGGTRFEIRKIKNGHLVISARWEGDTADIEYVAKPEDIGETVTARMVEYALADAQMESVAHERMIAVSKTASGLGMYDSPAAKPYYIR